MQAWFMWVVWVVRWLLGHGEVLRGKGASTKNKEDASNEMSLGFSGIGPTEPCQDVAPLNHICLALWLWLALQCHAFALVMSLPMITLLPLPCNCNGTSCA